MVKAIPRDSALVRALDPEGSAWGVAEHLLAAAVEHIDAGNRMFVMAHSKRGAQRPKPVVIPRPGVTPTKSEEGSRMSTKDEMFAFFARTS